MKIRWTWIACLALMTSCGNDMPENIIQPKVMEDVLYDYHLSLGMAISSRNTEKEAQKNYIFQKYNITEADFDSSMVWYTRESKKLMTIYENLDKKFKREYAHIERLLETREEANSRATISGDTVDISIDNFSLKSRRIRPSMKGMHSFGISTITSLPKDKS